MTNKNLALFESLEELAVNLNCGGENV